MATIVRMQGAAAAVQWGYYTAAELGPWQIDYGHLRAAVRRCDAFQVTQAPLYFVVDNAASGRAPFTRLLLEARLAGTTLTGRLGPKKG